MKTTNPKKKSEEKVGGYRFLAVLFFLLAVGGLFLGLLSNKLGDKLNGFFSLGPLYESGVIANSDKFLGGSLVGVVYGVILTMVDWFKAPNLANFNLFAGAVEGSPTKADLIASYALLGIVILLIITVIVSIVALCTIGTKKAVKKTAMASGILTFLSYGALFLLSYARTCMLLTGDTWQTILDFPTMAITAFTLLTLIIAAIARVKGYGLVNSLNLLLVLGAFIAFAYPTSQIASYLTLGGFDLFTGKDYLFITIAMAAFLGLITFNLFCSAIRNSSKKGFLFDIVRYALLLIGAGLLVVAFAVDKTKTFTEIFKADLVYTIILLAATLLPLVFAILEFVVAKKQAAAAKAKAKKEKEAAAKAAAEAEDDVPEIEMSNDDYIDEIVDDEIHRYVYEKRPEQPAQPVQPEPVQAAPQPQPEPAPQPIFQPNIIVQAPAQPQEEVKPREKTEFERRMEAIAREEEHPAPAPASRLQRDGSPALTQQPFTPVFTRQRKGKMQQMQMMDDEPASPYMAGNYDPFLSKLTSQEVSEFGDLFISNKYGMQNYLPVYVIGGDNSEFFNKVFIYLGRFRNYISSELLEKLNVYVSAIRTQK